MKVQKNVSTGHLDCCGEMICRGDIVVSLNGFGHVIWVYRKWWILHPGRRMEALNKYPAAELRRCDNGCDNEKSAIVTNCDKEILSHALSQSLSHDQIFRPKYIKPKV